MPSNAKEPHRKSPHPSSPHDCNDEQRFMDNGVMSQTQPPLPILLHADALPFATPLPTLPADRTTGNADDSTGFDHATIDVGPRGDEITTDDNALVINVTNDDNDEPPSMENDGMTQTQHHTTPHATAHWHHTTQPHRATRSSTAFSYSTRKRTTISPPIAHTSCQQDHFD